MSRSIPGAADGEPDGSAVPLLMVTGQSGAGLTTALKILEDLGYETVDNLPLSLLPGIAATDGARPLALGIDIRTRGFETSDVIAALQAIDAQRPGGVRLVFLAAAPEALLRRFEATRRRHPLAPDRPVVDGIRHERELIQPLRDAATLIIDTTDFAPVDLRRVLEGHFAPAAHGGMTISIVSFAYRSGVPREADLVFDVRFLRNPHYDPVLGPRTGNDPQVAAFVAADPGYAAFCTALDALLLPLLPRYRDEGKAYLTIAVGCTGGRHRSVVVAERLKGVLQRAGYPASLHHRDLAQPPQEPAEQGENPGGTANSRQKKAKGASA
jgi:UPF0042 nucleotide-binding protein